MKKMRAYLMLPILVFCINGISAQEADLQKPPETQNNRQTFKVSSELVEIRAVVMDKKGRIVENLNKEDFQLLDNNLPQPIDLFSVTQVDEETVLPSESEPASQKKPGKSVSVRRQLQDPSPRTVVLFVDTLHIQFGNLNWVKTNLLRFIDEKLNPRDTVAVITSDGNLGIGQQFTRDRQALRYAVEHIKLGFVERPSLFTPYLAALITLSDNGLTPTDALIEGRKIYENEENVQDRWYSLTRARARQILYQTSARRESTLQSLKDLIDQMIAVSGQRMIVIFSEGFSQVGNDGEYKEKEVRNVIDRAVNSGVVIYSVDAKGLTTGIDASLNSDAVDLANSHYQFASREEILDGLSDLAVNTGGELFRFTNNFSTSIVQAMDANRYYYNLGYYLNPDTAPPDLKDIKVTVPDHREYSVRIQRGTIPFDAEQDKGPDKENEGDGAQTPQQRLVKAVDSPVPKADLSVSAQMYFIRDNNDDKQVSLTVFLEGDKIRYTEKDRKHTFAIEILYGIYDSKGKLVTSQSNDIEGNLSPERHAQAVGYGYWFARRLALPPGAYQARIGVREKGTDRMGTTSVWVEVPDLKRTRFALSSLILLDPIPAETTDAGDISAGNLKQVKTVQGVRLYGQDEVCGYFFSLYPGDKKSDNSDLRLKMELRQGARPVLMSDWRKISVNKKDLKNNGGAYVGEKMNLAGLPPGIYELLVSVKDKKQTTQRSAILGIE